MKFLLILLTTFTLVFAQELEIQDFETDLYSKKGDAFSRKISLSLLVTGRDVEEFGYKVIDALNVVIGSFFAEDLLTSKGKEAFKKGFIKYASSKYSVEIDEIYIQKLFIIEAPKTDEIVEALRREGCCKM